ncbi:MAG TPA: hypothetical protein VJA21_14955, partial [Verrucomicrobiae bacterium]
MKSRVSPGNLSVVLFCATAGFLTSVVATFGEEVQHLSIIQPGGMPGLPVMTGIERVGTNDVRITWDGPSGYYQVLSGANLIAGQWQAIGDPNASRSATITNIHNNAFFRVSGPSSQYGGATACAECHDPVYGKEANTRHAGAYMDPAFVDRGG